MISGTSPRLVLARDSQLSAEGLAVFYDPIAIANYFIDLASATGEGISPLKLQKLIFYAHGWNLAIRGTPLINQQVEAWDFGPVIPRVYRVFREYGDRPVTDKGHVLKTHRRADGGESVVRWHTPTLEDEPGQASFTRKLLDRIWEIYGRYSATQLSNMTHQPGTPWEEAVRRCKEENGGQLLRGTDIPTELIKDYFDGLRNVRSSA